jgi:hypothetical protein
VRWVEAVLRVEVRIQATTGVVRLPARVEAEPDVEAEVARAWRSFEGGLDDEVVMRLGEPVVFVRRTALAGG